MAMRSRNAFTLIEVLAALAILSSALVVLLAAQQRSLSLMREQQDKEVADGLARELITDWKLRPNYQPPSEGQFIENSKWHWTRLEEPMLERDSTLRRTTLKVFRLNPQRQDQLVSSYVWLEQLNAKKP